MSDKHMNTIRPVGATHSDDQARYYKAGDELNWLRWFMGAWCDVGTLPAGTLSPLPSVQVVELEKFDVPTAPRIVHTDVPVPAPAPPQIVAQCMDELCVREALNGGTFCILHTVPKAPALKPSDAPKWDHPLPLMLEPVGVGFAHYFTKYQFVGSRVTCNPPLDTDQDVLVLVRIGHLAVMELKILAAGFTKEGSNPADLGGSVDKESVFHSYRKGDMNYIVTTDEAFYQRFSTATELARKYNLMEKSDRIQLFQAVLYGKWWA